MITKTEAVKLIAKAKEIMRADAEIMKSRPNKFPRGAWRAENSRQRF